MASVPHFGVSPDQAKRLEADQALRSPALVYVLDEAPLDHAILVIGGNGFIGRRVVAALEERGPSATFVAVRALQSGTGLHGTQVALDLNRAETFKSGVAGKTTIVHCARDCDGDRGPLGLRQLLDAAKWAGVKRFIYLSSIAVYGPHSGTVHESAPTMPDTTYGRQKLAAENLCRAAAAEGFQVVVLRPTLVYGAGGREWTERFLPDLDSGRIHRSKGHGERTANLVHVDDLAQFCAHLTNCELASDFTVLNVNGDDRPTWNSYFRALRTALGHGDLGAPVSLVRHGVRRSIRKVLRAALKFQHQRLPFIGRVSPSASRKLSAARARFAFGYLDMDIHKAAPDVVYSNNKAKELGFVARTTLSEASIDIAERYRKLQSGGR